MTGINADVLEVGALSAYGEGGCKAVVEYVATTLRDLGLTVSVRFNGHHSYVEVEGNQCVSHVVTPKEVGIDGDLVYDMEYFTNDFKYISLGHVDTITAAVAIVCTTLTFDSTPTVIEG